MRTLKRVGSTTEPNDAPASKDRKTTTTTATSSTTIKRRVAIQRSSSSSSSSSSSRSNNNNNGKQETHELFAAIPLNVLGDTATATIGDLHDHDELDASRARIKWVKDVQSTIALGDHLLEIQQLFKNSSSNNSGNSGGSGSTPIPIPIQYALSHIDGRLVERYSDERILEQLSHKVQWRRHLRENHMEEEDMMMGTLDDDEKHLAEKMAKNRIPPMKEWKIMIGRGVGCSHDETYADICLNCGVSLSNLTREQKLAYGTKVSVMHGDQKFQMKHSDARQADIEHQKRLLNVHKKLVLVLDIDHTLLQAMSYDPVTKAFDFLKQCGHELSTYREISGSMGHHKWRHILKLRPHLLTFLEETSKLCELHIFTHGDRTYANAVAQVLDPTGKLFGDRIISRTEMEEKSKKTLNHIFPSGDQAVMIVDDNLGVWTGHEANVFHIVPYIPFEVHFGITNREVNNQAGGRLSQSKQSRMLDFKLFPRKMKEIDEYESDNQLEILRFVIKRIHDMFFERYNSGQRSVHVKDLMLEAKSTILTDVHIVFSGVTPLGVDPRSNRLWRLAERMGASCYTQWRDEVAITHLVIANRDPNHTTEKIKKAEQTPGVFIVHTSWIEECYRYNKLLNEVDYMMLPHQKTQLPITRHYPVIGQSVASFQEAAKELMTEMRSLHFKLQAVDAENDDFSDLELSDNSEEEDNASDKDDAMSSNDDEEQPTPTSSSSKSQEEADSEEEGSSDGEDGEDAFLALLTEGQ